MSQILAIALLALRHTIRSRVILVLVALILAAAFLLPLGIRHDGTPAGLIRLHLTYTLGIAGFLLGLASLWGGCAAISQEADDKTLHLLLVKPVPRHRIWLGKWLAILLINAILLLLVATTAILTLRAKLQRESFDPAALAEARHSSLAALETFREPLPDVEADIRAELESLRTRRLLPDHLTEAAILDALRRAHLARLYSIGPGESRTWSFSLPRGSQRAPDVLLVQFRCDASMPGAIHMQARMNLRINGETLARDITVMPSTVQTVLFSGLPPGERLSLEFVNHGTHQASLFFDPADGLVLRRARGTFAGNYVRAILQLYLRLALFAAIGTTLGTLFSMPVAVFLTLVLVLVLQLSGFVSAAAQLDRETFVENVARFGAGGHSHDHAHGEEDHAHASPPPALAARATATALFAVYRVTWLALRPLIEHRAIEDLASATRIPPRNLYRDSLQQGLIFPAILALLSTAVLKKREWALPSLS